ncbi:hypothetical protein [Alteromonas lipolytica]|uniref:Uncharacterized protein n=1 Tax=Alteromonas lipolytica TaxID=1856405 RepID=A0A1E8FGH6_9ALTE|nr:hypothetical protein [Alteromonas lipolytica]OFI35045.1 hypothetical protein BFC17_15950 [Alteromonas lipolytica]GGF56169.1 hypothetical protein GCM10011338_05570 [Alteromonas lipolytica]
MNPLKLAIYVMLAVPLIIQFLLFMSPLARNSYGPIIIAALLLSICVLLVLTLGKFVRSNGQDSL